MSYERSDPEELADCGHFIEVRSPGAYLGGPCEDCAEGYEAMLENEQESRLQSLIWGDNEASN